LVKEREERARLIATGVGVRIERARLLRELRQAGTSKRARARCAELLMACEPSLEGITVYHLLKSCYRIEHDTARALLASASVDGLTLVGDIFARDALRLAAVLRGEAGA
jgi:hypothetical protein